MTTRVGDYVRPCFNARHHEQTGARVVPARVGNVFRVDAVSATPEPGGAVRINGVVWVKSWLKVNPINTAINP